MEIFIFIAIIVGAALLWNGYVRTKKAETDDAIDKWIPGGPGKDPEQHPLARFNTTVEADVRTSENPVEATETTVADVTAHNKAVAVAKAKKAPVKKAAASKAPRKSKTS